VSRERGCRLVPMNLLADVISPIVEPSPLALAVPRASRS
jgi:hypothetical protein